MKTNPERLAINNTGQIVGRADARAFVYTNGVMQFIDWYARTMTTRLGGGASQLKSVA